MKKMTEYTRLSGYLVKIFKMLNDDLFEGALSIPVITIQSTPKAYGHITVGKVWTADEQERHELNIGAGTLSRPIEETVATLVHEMVHLYNIQQGKQDTSRGYTYHNKIFKEEAEKRLLHIEHHPTYGWTITSPTDGLIEWILNHDLDEIQISRNDGFSSFALPPKTGGSNGARPPVPTTPKRPSSTRKYKCPCCGTSVRATKKVNIICADCDERMVLAQ